MNLDEIRELIRLMRENNLAEVDLESEGRKIRLVSAHAAPVAIPAPTYYPAPLPGPLPAAPSAADAPAEEPPAASNLQVIRSPLVGTFYRAPSPESPAYVKEGSDVNDDSVLCIIEAMKVMNEIKAETRGRIVEVLVENGHPVEFGQPLFRLEPAE